MLGEVEDTAQAVAVVDSAQDHGIDLHWAKSSLRGGIDAGADVADAEPGIGHGPEHGVVERVKADSHAVQTGLGESGCQPRQQRPVGGQRQIDARSIMTGSDGREPGDEFADGDG